MTFYPLQSLETTLSLATPLVIPDQKKHAGIADCLVRGGVIRFRLSPELAEDLRAKVLRILEHNLSKRNG